MRGVQMQWWNIHWGGRSWGSSSLIFIPAPLSRGEEGIFSVFSLDQKCHSIGAWRVLLIYKDDLVKRSQWAKDDLWAHEVPTFPHFSLPLGPLLPKNVWFPVGLKAPAFLCLPVDLLLFIRCLISCHLAPDPLSLFIPSYLLVVTSLYMRNTEGNNPTES